MQQTWADGHRLDDQLDAEGGAILKTALQGLMKTQPKDDKRYPPSAGDVSKPAPAQHRTKP